MLLLITISYTPSYGWPTLGYDRERSGYQMVPGADLTASGWMVKWRVPVTVAMQRICGPVLYDVRGDYPGQEVIFNDASLVQCIEGTSGSQLWSFSLADADLDAISTPAVGDVDNDGVPEVLVCEELPGILYCLNGATGAEEWRDTLDGQTWAPVCLTDVSGDGVPEIVVGSMFGTYARCYNGDGTLRWQSEALGSSASITGITSGDVTGDGVPEIIVAVQGFNFFGDKAIVCLDTSGSIIWKYPSGLFNYSASLTTPSLGDVDGDGVLDVIVAQNYEVNALRGSNASEIWTYNIPTNPRGDTLTTYYEALTAYDVDNDGRAEVFFGVGGGDTDSVNHDTTSWQSYLIGLDDNGSENFRYLLEYWSYDGGGALCDIDYDGEMEYMKTADDGFLYVLNPVTGALEWKYDWYDEDNQTEWATDPAIAVGDIDGDSCSEVVLLGSGIGSNYITALDGPGTSCLPLYSGTDEEGSFAGPRIVARPSFGVLWLRVYGFADAKAIIWDASGRHVAETLLSDKDWTRIELKPGIYFVKATHKDVVMKGKAVVR